MTTITTDGRTLADAATLARKLTDAARRVATLTIADGRAELVVGDGTTGVVEVIGHGSADPATRVAIAVDLDQLRTMRKVGDVTIRDVGGTWSMTATAEHEGVTSSVTSSLSDLVGEAPTWPTFPGEREPLTVDVRDDAAEVADALRSVADACGGSDARDVLTHVVLRDGEAAATDTYRLNVATVPVVGDGEALVPASWIATMPRRGVDRLTIVAEGGDGATAELTYRVTTRGRTRRVTIVGRVNPGPFPNYRSLIPTADQLTDAATMVVRSSLGDVVKPLGDHRTPVVLTLGDTPDVVGIEGSEGRTATYGTATTGMMTVAANPAFLADLVDHVGDGATLTIRDGLRAMLATGDGRTTLLMPMRVA
jgi:DNA polymerase III sliding clamp (beta) subunit (PCNA family)